MIRVAVLGLLAIGILGGKVPLQSPIDPEFSLNLPTDSTPLSPIEPLDDPADDLGTSSTPEKYPTTIPSVTPFADESKVAVPWYVACGRKWKASAPEPDRIYLKNDDGSLVTTTGKWYVPTDGTCEPFIRTGKGCGFITISSNEYMAAVVKCKAKGYEVAQPINRRKNIDGSNDTEKEGWHPYLIDGETIPEHYWFNWWEGVYVHSDQKSLNNFFDVGSTTPRIETTMPPFTNTPHTATDATTIALEQDWSVTCVRINAQSKQPERVYLLDDQKNKIITKGNYISNNCPNRGWTVGMVTVSLSDFKNVAEKCKEKGYKTAQPVGKQDLGNGINSEGYHPFLIDGNTVADHYFFHWGENVFKRQLMTKLSEC